MPRFRDRSYKFANSVYRSSAQLWAESVSKEKNMMKKIFTAMLLASAISFAPVAAWAQNEPAESAPAETHHHHHHHHHEHHHHPPPPPPRRDPKNVIWATPLTAEYLAAASAGAVAKKPDNPSQSSGSARERGGERGKALIEDPPFTSIVSTSPAGHPRPEPRPVALRGKILESPSIRTMTRNRLNATEGARRVIQPVHRNDPICLVPLDRQDL